MVSWHDLAAGSEADHDDWHSHEHLFERVAIPGFRRGRRCRAIAAPEEYFLMYEVDDLSVLTSEAYLARLNDPTEWSRRVIPSIRNMTRTLCRVLTSVGGGLGSAIQTIRFSADEAGKDAVIDWLTNKRLPDLIGRKGIVAAHLLEGDGAASGVQTDEARLRGGADRTADLVLIVEGYDPEALSDLMEDPLSGSGLVEEKTGVDSNSGMYRAVHVVTEADLPSA